MATCPGCARIDSCACSYDPLDPVSDLASTKEPTMNEEDDARLRGLMAVLALPPRRTTSGEMRRVTVEVEIAPDTWVAVDSVYIEADKLTVCRDGQTCFSFVRGEPVPRWRTPDIGRMVIP